MVRGCCKVCRYFIWVLDDRDGILKRGFCILGRGVGDYSLYVNSKACELFELDESKVPYHELEEKLYDELREKSVHLYYRTIRKLHEEGKLGSEVIKLAHAKCREFRINYVRKHRKDIEKLNQACQMSIIKYKQIITKVNELVIRLLINLPQEKTSQAPQVI